MSSSSRVLSTLVVLSLATGLSAPVSAAAPQGVSPGALDRLTTIRGECPTFSWEAVPGASFYELVVYALGGGIDPSTLSDEDLTRADEALYTQLPGGATSWTPSLEERLARGERYVWYVRGVVTGEAETEASSGDWSRGMFFAIEAMPSAEEVEMALEVLRDYRGRQQLDPAAAHIPEESSRSARSGHAAAAGDAARSSGSLQTAPAAIRGDDENTQGESYGVVGTSASPDGAGGYFFSSSWPWNWVKLGGPQWGLQAESDLSGAAEFTNTLTYTSAQLATGDYGIYASYAPGVFDSWSGWFNGPVHITGTLDVAGPVDWNPILTTYTEEASTSTSQCSAWQNRNFCALTTVSHTYFSSSGVWTYCSVNEDNGSWQVCARSNGTTVVSCTMTCF